MILKYNSCNTQFNDNTNVIAITGLYKMLTAMMLGLVFRKEYIVWSQLKPPLLFEILLLVV